MQLVKCDGRTFEVRTVGEVIFRLTSRAVPIKAHGVRLMSDEDARRLCREFLDAGLYDGGRV